MTEKQTRPLYFGVGFMPSRQEFDLAGRIATLADATGLDFISAQDHPYNAEFLDTWTILTVLGARTERVRLLSDVSPLPLRPPAMLAKAMASLDLLTNGRVELGLGAGGLWDAIASYGGPRRTPGEAVEALEEGIEVIRALWQPSTSPPVNVAGKYYQLLHAQPGPAPAHPIGIWLGALGPRMLRLTGRLADGWIISAGRFEPEEILSCHQIIDEAARSAGRDPRAILRGYNISGLILAPGKLVAAPPRRGQIVGTVSDWVEELVNLAQNLRMNSFFAHFLSGTGDGETQIRLFAEEIVPAVRERLRSTPPA
jgi:alkanesulfonate monooxygenase SsuD/methylene tetrahydromethanopterin reductase-like flavin-dependent oxidoreductase (luciferase family)